MLLCLSHILLKTYMVEKETISAISKQQIKLWIHSIHILADSIFDIITLRGIGRKLIDTEASDE